MAHSAFVAFFGQHGTVQVAGCAEVCTMMRRTFVLGIETPRPPPFHRGSLTALLPLVCIMHAHTHTHLPSELQVLLVREGECDNAEHRGTKPSGHVPGCQLAIRSMCGIASWTWNDLVHVPYQQHVPILATFGAVERMRATHQST
eukprot:6377500-Amphidinium_carterae.2